MNGGRWIILDRLANGTRAMGSNLAAWLTPRELPPLGLQAAKLAGGPEAGKAALKPRELAGLERAKVMAQRAAGAFVSAWFVGGILYALGALMWALALGWFFAALYASRGYHPAAPGAPKLAPALAGPAGRERAGLLAVLAEILADRSGIHLLNLGEQMRDWPAYAELDGKQLRALLTRHGVPVHQSVTADGVRGRSGIKRVDIEALLTPPPLPAAPRAEEEPAVDLWVSSSSFLAERSPEGDACTAHELGDDTLAMLREVNKS